MSANSAMRQHPTAITSRFASAMFAISLLFAAAIYSQQTPSSAPPTLRSIALSRNIAIGAAAPARLLSDAQYTAVLASEFSQLEPENEMKFGPIHPRPDSDSQPYDFVGADSLVAFAHSHSMRVRGHTLVWHKQVPDWVTKGNLSSSQLASVLHDHIHTVVTRYASKVYAWDVVNEAFDTDGSLRETVWRNQPGIGAGPGTKYIEQALRWANEADPAAKLFYNDYDTEVINAKSDAIYAMAKDFKERGVPLDGVGFQAHVTLKFDDPAKLESFARNLERFAKLGLELNITELDVRLDDSTAASFNAEGKLYGEIATICVRQPACKLIQTWGITDKHSWIPYAFPGKGWALPWDENYQKKPAYDALRSAFAK
ncbi:MAG TPA: endo-1,4-beta-xylanase [Candidatus Acidoferrum sp.]|nr:endo-1,4-beta-xylanase [Candidatus Acidoferrum sp.]